MKSAAFVRPPDAPSDVAELLRRVDFEERQVRSLSGDAKIRVQSEQGTSSVPSYVAVAEPSSIHFELLDFFGRPQSVMKTDGQSMGLYVSSDNIYIKGPASPQNVKRAVMVEFSVSDLSSLLLGRFPRLEFDRSELAFDEKTGFYIATLSKAGRTQKLEVESTHYRIVRSTIDGPSGYTLSADDLAIVDGISLWRHLHVVMPKDVISIDLWLKDVSVNTPVDAALFDLAAPEGVPTVEVDEFGRQI